MSVILTKSMPARFRLGRGVPLYCLIDAARNPAVLDTLNTWKPQLASLFSDHSPAAMQSVAPYLVRLSPGAPFTRAVTELGWGRDWLMLIESLASLVELRTHLRKFLLVKDHNDRSLFFRFYDSRVLRAYLPTLNDAEAAEFFGPVRAFLCPALGRDALESFQLAEAAVV